MTVSHQESHHQLPIHDLCSSDISKSFARPYRRVNKSIFNYSCMWSMILSSPSRVLIICFFTSSSSRTVSGTPPTSHLQLTGPPLLPARNSIPPATTHFSSLLLPARVEFLDFDSASLPHIRHSRRAEIPRHSVRITGRCPCCGGCRGRGQSRPH